jgi:hypothetical protein
MKRQQGKSRWARAPRSVNCFRYLSPFKNEGSVRSSFHNLHRFSISLVHSSSRTVYRLSDVSNSSDEIYLSSSSPDDGSMRNDKRQESLEKIKNDPNIAVILISFKSGSVGKCSCPTKRDVLTYQVSISRLAITLF